jgi:putative hemolysin
MIVNIILLIGFMLLSAFFSASETAIFSLTKPKLRRLKEKYPSAKRLKVIFRKPSLFLTTIVFGNMLVNIGLASLSALTFVSLWGDKGIVPSILFSGLIILFLGEIFPKTLAVYRYERLSLLFSPMLIFITNLLYPILNFIQKIVDRLSHVFLRKEKKTLPEEEIKEALFLGKKEGQISEAEEEMITYVLEFKDTRATEVMTPRVDIEGIDIETGQEEVMKILKEEKHSKFPIYRESLDNIVGVVYAKDLFLNPEQNWRSFIRKPIFVPESRRIDDLLKVFLETGERIVIVLDEYGGTSGLVTLEDVKEEIFGEIYDEFETPSKMIENIDKNTFRVFGKIPIKILNLELELSLPEEMDTLAGFILSRLERIPHPGERFEYQGVEFTIERATARRVVSVVVKIKK